MKKKTLIGLFIIGSILFLLVCTPAFAISKTDLMSYYRTDPVSSYTSYSDSSHTQRIEDKSKEIPSTPSVMPFPEWPDSTFLKPFSKPSIPSSPIVKPSLIPATKSCPPAVPSRPLYHAMVYCSCSPDSTCDCVNPETGEHYPIGMDCKGNTYIVKPGCQCTWGDGNTFTKCL